MFQCVPGLYIAVFDKSSFLKSSTVRFLKALLISILEFELCSQKKPCFIALLAS